MAVILGIDPGSKITGYGLIKIEKNQPCYLASGSIKPTASCFGKKLFNIFSDIKTVINMYQPTAFAIEQVFVDKNPNSAIKLGQARGAAIVAASSADLALQEYTPTQVKKIVTGKGNASKQAIQQMITKQLKLNQTPPEDAADALAIALCCYFYNKGLV